MHNQNETTQEAPKKERPPMKKLVVKFNTKTRTWKFTYTGWDGVERTVQFELEKTLKDLCWEKVDNDLHRLMKVGVYINNDKNEKVLITTLAINLPNFWPDRDPQQKFSDQDLRLLYSNLVRDVHNEWLQRLANGWRNKVAQDLGALNVELDYSRDYSD